MKKVELVSPAGNLEKLKIAFQYGADAVYLGGPLFNLRERSDNFSFSDLKKALALANNLRKKIYFALNIYFYNNDFPKLNKYLDKLKKIGIEYLIVSDMGAVLYMRENYPFFKIHLSTQANATNVQAFRFFQKNGVERIVVAREMTLKDIKKVKKENPDIEIETFVHGAMCMSYSGRCMLSAFYTGRSANRGDCAQSCRWEYELVEKTRPTESMPIVETTRGTYILSSKDMNLAEYIPQLIRAGIDSFKIEGRMKSIYYVAVVTKVYRTLIDAYYQKKKIDFKILKELDFVSHRPYFTGFYFTEASKSRESQIENQAYIRKYNFLGYIKKKKKDLFLLELKGKIENSSKLDVLLPAQGENSLHLKDFILLKKVGDELQNTERLVIQDVGYIKTDFDLPIGAILRTEVGDNK